MPSAMRGRSRHRDAADLRPEGDRVPMSRRNVGLQNGAGLEVVLEGRGLGERRMRCEERKDQPLFLRPAHRSSLRLEQPHA